MLIALLAGCGPSGVLGWFVVVEGRVVDEDQEPVAAATIRLLAESGDEITTVYSGPDGSFSSPIYGTELNDNILRLQISAGGYSDGIARLIVNFASPELHSLRAGPGNTFNTVTRRLPTMRLADAADEARVTGQIRDAVSGQPVSGLSLLLQHGWNADEEEPAADRARTDANGQFRLTAGAPGMYTVYVEAERGDPGWLSSRFPALLTADGGSVQGLVSQGLNEGQTRAALVWPEGPRDLDLHLSAPQSDGTGAYDIYEDDPAWPAEGNPDNVEAILERADDNGDGPETILIRKKPGAGDILISVHDPDHADDPESVELGGSQALVQVWFEGKESRFYQVDPLEPANWWRPVEISSGLGDFYEVEQYATGVRAGEGEHF